MPKKSRRTVSQKSTRSRSRTSKPLPRPPSLWRTIGPSFILLGLALGSGELILWPYLAANYGLGLLWGALLGISFQFVLNTEVMRFSLARGESVFVGFARLSKLIPLWYIFSTLIPWSLPGFSSATSQILSNFTSGKVDETWVAVGLLLFTGVVLSVGKTLYRTMEVIQKSIIFVGMPFIIVLTFWLTKGVDWQEALRGLAAQGDGWWFFPKGIALASFLGAFAYSGAGGNLNLAQSYYVKEKGFGMGKYAAKITSLFSRKNETISIEGEHFAMTPSNRKIWQKWWKLVNLEHVIVFWFLGLITIVFLAVLAKVLVYGGGVESGLSFLYAEATVISSRTLPVLGPMFLGLAALMLFSTQLGVLESSSRIISENVMLVFYIKRRKINLSKGFYIALWSQILLGIAIYTFGFQEPRFLLTLSAVLNAAAMMVSFPLLYFLNKKSLHSEIQPSKWRIGMMLAAFLFFILFLGVTLIG